MHSPHIKPIRHFENENEVATQFVNLLGRVPRPNTEEANTNQTGPNDPRVYGYEILSCVGSGGMGVVYKARHLELNRIVALKVLRGAALDDPDYRNRFRAEAEAVARLQHPNIIQIFEVGVAELSPGTRYSSPFISLEFVDGGSLTEKTDKPQSPRYAAEVLEKLARAVQSAHDQGVIHRDLKPANVLLTNEGEPKIADFGIAKQLGGECAAPRQSMATDGSADGVGRAVTQAGVVMGTPEYMSPEQVAGTSPTPAFDIYGLGVILYQLLTARVPFQGIGPTETMMIAQLQEPVSPRKFKPDLSRDLETICLKCLEKKPGNRYPSAQALADDLRRFLDGRTIMARRANGLERVGRWCGRNPVVTVSLACLAATVILAIMLISHSYWQTEQAYRQTDLAWQNEKIQRQEAERKERAERWERYRANIAATSGLLETYDVGGAERNLLASPEEYRNWEWRHFNSRIDLSDKVLDFTGMVPRISGDGSRLVFFGADHVARVYRTSDGLNLRNVPSTPLVPVLCASLNRDGTWLATSSSGPIVLKNLDDDRTRTLTGLEERPITIMFSDDGKRLFAKAGQSIRVWDTGTEQTICAISPYQSNLYTSTLSPTGRRMVVSNLVTKEVGLWDVDTGRLVALLPGHKACINRAGFTRDGARVVTCESYPSNEMRLWDTETGKLLGIMTGHSNSINECTFSPDGTRIATTSMDQTARLWDGLTGQPIAKLAGHAGWLFTVDFSPDGKRLVTSSQDHTLRLWDGLTGEPINVLPGHTIEALAARFTPDGKFIVSFDKDGIARLWDTQKVENDHFLRGHTTFIYSVAFHPDGKRVVSGAWDGTARVWDSVSRRQLSMLDHGKGEVILSVAVHPDGKLLATRTRSSVRLWEIDSGQEVQRWDTPFDRLFFTRLAFSGNGELLASSGTDRALYLWDVKSRTLAARLEGQNDMIRDVVFGRDGKWVASAGDYFDRSIRIWDIAEQRQVKVLDGHTAGIVSLGLSKDGTLLASGSFDGTVRLWDTTTWTETAVLNHRTNVYCVAFTPDGTRLACACANNTIRVWDIATRQDVVDLRGHKSYVHAVAFSPDGNRLISGSGDHTLHIWDTNRR